MADIRTICIFSEVSGILLLKGKPIINATVIRSFDCGTITRDETSTDLNGAFSFPALYQKSFRNLLPLEFVVAQSMVVIVEGNEHSIWSNTKRSRNENSELGGLPLILRCELTSEIQIHRQFGSILRTNCTW